MNGPFEWWCVLRRRDRTSAWLQRIVGPPSARRAPRQAPGGPRLRHHLAMPERSTLSRDPGGRVHRARLVQEQPARKHRWRAPDLPRDRLLSAGPTGAARAAALPAAASHLARPQVSSLLVWNPLSVSWTCEGCVWSAARACPPLLTRRWQDQRGVPLNRSLHPRAPAHLCGAASPRVPALPGEQRRAPRPPRPGARCGAPRLGRGPARRARQHRPHHAGSSRAARPGNGTCGHDLHATGRAGGRRAGRPGPLHAGHAHRRSR